MTRREIPSEILQPIEVRSSPIGGRGVFANADIGAGRSICLMGGEAVDLARCIWRVVTLRARIDDPLSISAHDYLLLDHFSNSFNHSCAPNIGLTGSREMISIRAIKAGEELVFDYSTTVPVAIYTAFWRMRCGCGAASCRRWIGNIGTLSAEKLRYHVETHSMPDHALEWWAARQRRQGQFSKL